MRNVALEITRWASCVLQSAVRNFQTDAPKSVKVHAICFGVALKSKRGNAHTVIGSGGVTLFNQLTEFVP